MNKRNLWMVILMVALMALWGCSDDDDDPAPVPSTFETLVKAMDDYINSDGCPGVIPASTINSELNADADSWFVIDIRREADYNAGHIANANTIINATLTGLKDAVADWDKDQKIVITCYSGQSAGFAKLAMELWGFTNVHSLKWGMSDWHTENSAPWDGGLTDNTLPVAMIETDNNADDLETHDYPEPMADTVDGCVDALLAEGFSAHYKKFADDVLPGLEDGTVDWFILNYHPLNVYLGEDLGEAPASNVPGHIEGAFQFTPRESLGWGEMLENIPTDRPVLVYCWTGQTSAQIAGYLSMLGYDAYTLSAGVNNLFYDELNSHKWAGTTNEFPKTDPMP